MITSDQLKDAQDRVEALHRYLDIDAKTMQLEDVNNESIDITDRLSETEAFSYEYTDAGGSTHLCKNCGKRYKLFLKIKKTYDDTVKNIKLRSAACSSF